VKKRYGAFIGAIAGIVLPAVLGANNYACLPKVFQIVFPPMTFAVGSYLGYRVHMWILEKLNKENKE
jgi:hypothetical protein